jgi:glyoxylase-like metal-dependent hydrolase (beta-lactamase superfamily II)
MEGMVSPFAATGDTIRREEIKEETCFLSINCFIDNLVISTGIESRMLCWDQGLRLSAAVLYLDCRDRKAACFISHAHADHLGVHESAIATAIAIGGHCRSCGHDAQLAGPEEQLLLVE